MPDEIDIANDYAQRTLEQAIAAARVNPKSHQRVDQCLNECGEPPAEGSSYCCHECKVDAERRQAIRRCQGVA
ncbi:hypothetical protein [Ralstonia sp. ASV6]|uniref:hypothetical protein n=1 Tax=Ralstonia sp. ASV6 TaxID=2795124 RepID=UPI0018EC931A|nr:hypothetical protein [Ralstonia sp. ASV6]